MLLKKKLTGGGDKKKDKAAAKASGKAAASGKASRKSPTPKKDAKEEPAVAAPPKTQAQTTATPAVAAAAAPAAEVAKAPPAVVTPAAAAGGGDAQGDVAQADQVLPAGAEALRKLPRQLSSRFSSSQQNLHFEKLPSFRDVQTPEERVQLFQSKVRQCCTMFSFTDPTSQLNGKDLKRQTLVELVEFVTNLRAPLPDAVWGDIVAMLATNLFRALPPTQNPVDGEGYDPEEDEPVLEAAWPHLQVVYEFLLRLVESSYTDPSSVKRYIDTSFILQLLDLFDSEDPRERDFLKTTLHRVYGKFLTHRAFIRRAITNTFFTFIYETERHNGIAELLEILGSIINGFAQPLKEEHKVFLSRALLPLHMPRSMTLYHQQLTYCLTQYAEKDSQLTYVIVMGLLKYWPMTNSPKSVLFISELEEILELTEARDFVRFQEPLFNRLSQCIASPNFQIAEKALFLFQHDYIVSLIADNRKVILPLVFGALYKNSKSHWNNAIHGLTYNVLKLFMELDAKLFDECSARFKSEQQKVRQQEVRRKKLWVDLEVMAKKNSALPTPMPVPYADQEKPVEAAGGPVESDAGAEEPENEPLEGNIEEALDSLRQEPPAFEAPSRNMRRRSVLPQDANVMQLLQQHKSLDDEAEQAVSEG